MPTLLTVDDVSFREVSVQEGVNFDGSDSLVVTLRGATSLLPAARALYTRYSNYTGYPNMYLVSKSSVDRGVKTDLILTYAGYIDSDVPQNGLLRKSSDTTTTSVQLVTSTGENVSFDYNAQTTTYDWISRGSAEPGLPQFSLSVPSSLPLGYLYNPSPANYTGSITSSYKMGARCSPFTVSQITPSLFMVNETWRFEVQPA